MKTEKGVITTDRWNIPYISTMHEGDKRVLLCLHGFAGDKESSVVEALMETLYEKCVGAFVFDWPAHGESVAKDSELTVENCLEDLKTVMGWIRERTYAPVSCFATSFGGYIASLYAHEFPEQFEYLILRSPALRMHDVFTKLLPNDDLAGIMQGKNIVMGFERKMSIGKDFIDSLARNDAFDLQPPHPDRTLIIQGDRDEVVDARDIVRYADKNGIKLALFAGADHRYKNPEEKERIVSEVESFMGI